jgi:cytochrome b subunit of formate dehydrogenase
VLQYYERSVHGQALMQKGNLRAAVCTDCHGAHNVRPGSDPDSTVARVHIPQTCGKCHAGIKAEYHSGIHGQSFRKGTQEAPVCTSCHGEHTIRSPKDVESAVHPTHISATCGKCHESMPIQQRFGLPAERVGTFNTSFHGIALSFGEVRVANCASCHEAHAILPSSDPRSSIHKENLKTTCGKCHPNASVNFAAGKVHVEELPKSNLGVYLVAVTYRAMIWGMVFFFIGMILLDLAAHARERGRRAPRGPPARSGPPGDPPLGSNGAAEGGAPGSNGDPSGEQGPPARDSDGEAGAPKAWGRAPGPAPPAASTEEAPRDVFIERLSLHARLQHMLLIIGMVTLMATGLPLRAPLEWGWLRELLTFPGSFALRGWLHRAGALLLIAAGVYHITYVLLSRRGHADFQRIMFNKQDARDFWHMLKYYFGRAPHRPRFHKFGYIEKFEYFAVAWGSVVMVATGFTLWFMEAAMLILPKWAWDIARAIHGYEALLAFFAIIIWHFYTVHFNPTVFPMSRVFLTGKISAHQMREEHPAEYDEWRREHGGSGTP